MTFQKISECRRRYPIYNRDGPQTRSDRRETAADVGNAKSPNISLFFASVTALVTLFAFFGTASMFLTHFRKMK
jgi:hypothetical protein